MDAIRHSGCMTFNVVKRCATLLLLLLLSDDDDSLLTRVASVASAAALRRSAREDLRKLSRSL